MTSLKAADLFSVKGMVFVITGGGSGLGSMMALALDANGASKVFILGRRMNSLESTASKAQNGSIIPITCDTSSKDSLSAAVAAIEKQTPFINVLIANSGVTGPITAFAQYEGNPSIADIQKTLWAPSLEDSNAALGLNTMSTFYTCIAFLHLLDAGNTHADSVGSKGYVQSQIIATSSIAGFARKDIIGYSYSASKAAVTHVTKMLSTQFAPYGIRANALAPGIYPSEATEPMFGGANPRTPGALPKEQNPATRSGSEEDMAGAILYLTSRAGGYVNGAVLLTDGGEMAVSTSSY